MEKILPKSIPIYGKRFAVREVKNSNFLGMMDYDSSTIYINFSLHKKPKHVIHTFWHEIFHAFHYRLGLHQCLSSDVLEILAESQATLIVEMFY